MRRFSYNLAVQLKVNHMKYLFLVCCVSIATSIVQAQTNSLKDAAHYYNQAVAAYEKKDFPGFLSNMIEVNKLRKNYPRMIYNLAAAYCLNHQEKEASVWLSKIADMGLAMRPEKDSDFVALWGTKDFQELMMSFDKNRTPLNHSTEAFKLPEKDLIPESVAYDAQDKVFYISSVHKRKVVSRNAKGLTQDLSHDSDGLWSTMGMKVDVVRRHLWVTSTGTPQMDRFDSSDDGKTGVFKYDLKTKKLLKKYLLPGNGRWFGDLAVAKSGDVFITDSKGLCVYKIGFKTDSLELWIPAGPFYSPQGLDFSGDEKYLFVADYSRGVLRFDMQTREYILLDMGDRTCALGIDGMYFYKNSLIAVQNGVSPNRVVRFFLNKSMDEIERFEALEANHPLFKEPTLGVLESNEFYYIANSQWDSFDKQNRILPADKLFEPVVLKLKL